MELRLPAYRHTDFGLLYLPLHEPMALAFEDVRADGNTIVSLGLAPRTADHLILTQDEVIVSATPGSFCSQHASWNLVTANQSVEMGGSALAVLGSGQATRSLLVLTDGKCTLTPLSQFGSVQRSPTESVYNPVEDLAWHSWQDRLVVLHQKPPSVRFYSLTDRGMVLDCVFELPGVELLRGEVDVATSGPRLVVRAHRCLLVYTVSGYKLKLTARHELLVSLAGIFCRDEHVVAVMTDGRVCYLDMQLKPVFEFKFGRPVSAAAFFNETWAILSERRVLLCQDKFYVRD